MISDFIPSPNLRQNELRPFGARTLFPAALCLAATLASSAVQAQTSSDNFSTPAPRFAQSSSQKKRIVFDYNQPEVTPVPTASPSPTPTPEYNVEPATTMSDPIPATVVSPASVSVSESKPNEAPAPSINPQPISTPTSKPEPALASATPPTKQELQYMATPVQQVEEIVPVPMVSTTPAATPVPVAQAPAKAEATPVEGPLPVPAVEKTNVDVVENAGNTDLAPAVIDERPMPPSQSVTINLINKLVQRGVLSKEDAADMIKQAEAEAQVAREETQADMIAIAQAAAAQAASDQIAIAEASGAPASDDDVRVTYIPEPVKLQIKEDIKTELLADSRAGKMGLGPKPFVPEWVSRIRPFADFRFRYEGDYFPQGNDATGAFPNFNAINTGAPFDVTGNEFAPQYNVDQDRNRFRIRVRLGAEMDITRNLTAGIRLATGENNSPVTTNQTVGLANQGQGGNFSKYAIWLDRAFVRYDIGEDPNRKVSLWVGRFDNPFFSTNLIWDDDLGFDGLAMQARYEVHESVTPFFTGGVFPVFNTDFNFSSNQPTKFKSYDKYLLGGQLGVDWNIAKDWQLKLATSYYYFYNVEGKLSSPFTPLSPDDAGDTDNSRPSFAQKGNTYFPIRNIIADASNDFGAIDQYQYYGLATPFQELAVTGRLDYNGFEPVQVSLIAEFVQNLAFNQSDINAVAVNNRGANDDDLSNSIGDFEGSPQAWNVDVRVGTPALAKAWDWGVTFGYRWIGSDAVVDGFNDSDFGLGGTNMKGFTVGGALALSPHVWMGLRWMGSDSIAGPTFKVSIVQFDLHTKF